MVDENLEDILNSYTENEAKNWKEKGNQFFKDGDYENALNCFNKALDIDPEYTDAWNNKALVLHKQGKIEEAKKCIEHIENLKESRGNKPTFNNQSKDKQNLPINGDLKNILNNKYFQAITGIILLVILTFILIIWVGGMASHISPAQSAPTANTIPITTSTPTIIPTSVAATPTPKINEVTPIPTEIVHTMYPETYSTPLYASSTNAPTKIATHSSSSSSSNAGKCYVSGYYRKDGTYVNGYYRTC